MPEVTLTINAPSGRQQVRLTEDRLAIGRSDSAGLKIDDQSLSRVHASINRDGDRIWILDEGSTNGTFVNGDRVLPAGLALRDGDRVELSQYTTITVSFNDIEQLSGPQPSSPHPRRAKLIIAGAAVFGLLLIALAAASSSLFDKKKEDSTANRRDVETVITTGNTGADSERIATSDHEATDLPPRNANAVSNHPLDGKDAAVSRKRYQQMNDQERMEFIDREAHRVSVLISNRAYVFNDDVLRYIKKYVDGYASRVGNRSNRLWGEDLDSVFQRAQQFSPIIIRSFNARGVPPAVGLYIVMIETEYHNIRSENSAGAAGLFQFIGPTARAYGVDPADRNDVDKMAPAAAHYLAERIAEFGPDAMSVALAIAGYNRSPDSVRRDLQEVLNSDNKERSFWTLVANSDKLDHWFQNENVKYVPKFFAAAIIGENPWAFGLDMNPLSTYSRGE